MARLTGTELLDPTVEHQVGALMLSEPCERCARVRCVETVNTVAFDTLTVDAYADAMRRFISCGRSHAIHFLAVHPTVVAREVPRYRALLNSGDLIVSDGTPLALTLKAKGRVADRITAADGFDRTCRDGVGVGLRHFFVGGASDSVAEAMQRNLRQQYPDMQIAGFEVPPFRPYDEDELAELVGRIRAAKTDVVWVGLGAPKQDILANRLRLLDAAPAVVCIGAVFDFVAGTKRRAPKAMRVVGLEWLFRLMLEPRRLGKRYFVGNARFLGAVLCDELRTRRANV